ncbi:ParM/StbA family protein [Bacillus sp. FSL R12-0069]|uniref:ParM/StbA family protein n=1 Tax=Bacillus sp. FSL R12-0069 TaxID=2975342 RepID=UPI0030FAE320
MRLKNPYAIDLGNGFSKRIFVNNSNNKVDVKTELSILSPVDEYYNKANFSRIELLNTGDPYYIGEDARKSKISGIRAVEKNEVPRYKDLIFKKQLFGFIARDFKENTNVTIPLLVTGLPVAHYETYNKLLQEIITTEVALKVNNELLTIHIEKCLVVPQPIGTQYYLIKKQVVTPDDRILIIDGGFGTIDVTDIVDNSVISRLGLNIGCEKAFLNIEKIIRDNIGSTSELNTYNMHYILNNYYKYNGIKYNLSTFQKQSNKMIDFELQPNSHVSGMINFELQRHFETVLHEISQKYNFAVYDKIIWTGGMASLHEHRIHTQKEKFPTFEVIENGVEANVLGYYYLGYDKLFKNKSAIEMKGDSEELEKKELNRKEK